MTIKWNCDALLPTAERYASLKFRRFAPQFKVDGVGYDEACELAAFAGVVPWPCTPYVFHWSEGVGRHAKMLMDYMKDDVNVLDMVKENLEGMVKEDGLAVLGAMQDGGWRHGQVPKIVRMAMLDYWAGGLSQPKIGRLFNVTVDQAINMMGRRQRLASRADVWAGSMLTVG